MQCEKCGKQIDDGIKFCPECGANLSEVSEPQKPALNEGMMFCPHCAAQIPKDAVICTSCGRQVREIAQAAAPTPQVIVNSTNVNTNTVGTAVMGRQKNKWVALALCFFLGVLGAHKFYEGKAGMGILYIFTVGLFGIGVIVDFIRYLFKPTYYYV